MQLAHGVPFICQEVTCPRWLSKAALEQPEQTQVCRSPAPALGSCCLAALGCAALHRALLPGAFPKHPLAAEQGMVTFGDHDGLIFPVKGARPVQAGCGQGQSCSAVCRGALQISPAAPRLPPAELSTLTVG